MDLILKIINLLGGLSILITAIIAYVGKLYFERFKANQEAKNRELQASIDATSAGLKSKLENSVYVTKNQFDKEFTAYSVIWSSVFELKEDTIMLRPVIDYFDQDESFNDRKLRRLRKFKDSFNLLVRHVESNRPFIPVDIYNNINGFKMSCRKESISYEHGNPDYDGVEYWKDSEKNMKEIVRMLDLVCEDIRSRLFNLSVIE
ncbi:hypothetical protein OLN68_06105 [Citrobacter freundii]|nr:hypothetical protein [Citrobacter freundii]MCW1445227.1 hypothetical protein [Citrobacter freundii]